MKRKKDYRETLASFQIHTKDGKEKFLNEVAKWWEAMYPAKADWFKTNLRRLREINKNTDGSYRDSAGREYFVTYRVPRELLMFIQQWDPDFAKDSADVDLLCRVWCDLVRVGKDRRRHTRLVVTQDWSRRPSEPVDRPEDQEGKGEGTGEDDPPVDAVHCSRCYAGDCACVGHDHREELREEPREDADVSAPELPPR